MANMSYCRHENTAADLEDVWDQWNDYKEGTSEYEDEARKRILRLIVDMYESLDLGDPE